jgi:hypothetical protein
LASGDRLAAVDARPPFPEIAEFGQFKETSRRDKVGSERRKQASAQRRNDQEQQRNETATTVRVQNGKTQVLNGPYAEVKEQLGGYYIIEATDLNAAIGWAARCPGAAHGAVEVRPIWAM